MFVNLNRPRTCFLIYTKVETFLGHRYLVSVFQGSGGVLHETEEKAFASLWNVFNETNVVLETAYLKYSSISAYQFH